MTSLCAVLIAAAAALAPADSRAPLELLVNGVSSGRVIQVVLREGDAWVALEDLRAAGLGEVQGLREPIDGQEHVSLRSLAPAVRFQIDEAALALRLTTTAAALPSSELDLSPSRRPEGLVYHRDTSAFLNYSVQALDFSRVGAFAEAGLSISGNLLSSGVSRQPDGKVVRGLSSFLYDEPAKLRRWTIGDGFVPGDALGGGAILGGLGVASEFSLDPYFVKRPLPRSRSVALTPSTLDVYVNGVLVRQEQLAPGVYDLANLPLPTGAGSVRTVVRDAFGRTEELSSRFYLPQSALAKGLHEYRYSAGFARTSLSESFDYGRPLLFARHRTGLTDSFTLGGRLEAGQQLFSLGPSATLALPAGELELSAALSRDWHRPGAAASLSYGYVLPGISAGFGVRTQSPRYANAQLRAQDDRATLQANAFVGVPAGGRVTLSLDLVASRFRDQGDQLTANLRQDLRLAKDLAFSVTESRAQGPGQAPSLALFASLTWSFGERATADATAQGSAGARSMQAGVQRSLPVGPGYGYRLRGNLDDASGGGLAELQLQGEHGYLDAQLQRAGHATSTVVTASGSVVRIGGETFFARPVQDGFALIQVPGVEGVRGFVDNQEVGQTDARGNLLVPALQPYYGNRLSIRDADVPMDFELGPTEQLVAAPYRGGALARFEVGRIRSVQGRLELGPEGRATVPAYGELAVTAAGKRVVSPIGSGGLFALENLPAGVHSAQLEYRGRSCSFALSVPEAAHADLGTLRCEAGPITAQR